MVLAVKNICKSFGADTILNNISFHLENNEKLAITGVNGAGKTTLFKIITGELPADSGEIIVPANIQIGYMAQLLALDPKATIEEEFLKVYAPLIKIESDMKDLTASFSKLTGSSLENAMNSYEKLNFIFEQENGYEYKSRIRGVISGLGFKDEENKLISVLSGGQKTRVSLGKLLLNAPDVLLLDEPTNHLDIESINWLEDFVRSYPKSVIIISHDRYFLNKTVQKVVEIENTNATLYHGNYSFFSQEKELQRQSSLKRYLDQQKIIKKQEESIRLLKSFNREKSVKRAESKQKQLDKLERFSKPDALPDKIRIDLTPRIQSGNDVLFGENLAKSFGSKKLFSGLNLEIKKSDKIALIGPNGIGKTTLLRIILDEISADAGKVTLGHNVKIGYYDQGQQALNENKTIVEEISDAYPRLTTAEIRNVLAAFVFTGDDVFKEISKLSGGEKGRVSLAKIMLSGANFLLLDEPTNHLDMNSKEILEEALQGYNGTILFISHDRYFINATANKVFEMSQSGMKAYFGDYDYYIDKKNSEKEEESNNINKKESVKKDNWLSKKEAEASSRKIQNRIKKLNVEIKHSEAILEELSQKLHNPEIGFDHEKVSEIYFEKENVENTLLEFYEELEELEAIE